MAAFFASLWSFLLRPLDWVANMGGGSYKSVVEGSELTRSSPTADDILAKSNVDFSNLVATGNTKDESIGSASFSPYSYIIGIDTSVTVNQDTIEVFDPDGISQISTLSNDRVILGTQRVSDERQIIQLGSLFSFASEPYTVGVTIYQSGRNSIDRYKTDSEWGDPNPLNGSVEVPAPSSSNPDVSPAPLPIDDYLMT